MAIRQMVDASIKLARVWQEGARNLKPSAAKALNNLLERSRFWAKASEEDWAADVLALKDLLREASAWIGEVEPIRSEDPTRAGSRGVALLDKITTALDDERPGATLLSEIRLLKKMLRHVIQVNDGPRSALCADATQDLPGDAVGCPTCRQVIRYLSEDES